MTCLSQSEQCRGELFRPDEKSFATLHHSHFVSASSYWKSNLLSHKCTIRYLLDCNKNQERHRLSCNQKCKIDISSITRQRTFNFMYASY